MKNEKKKNFEQKIGHSYCINCIVAGCWLAGRWLSARGVRAGRAGRARQAGMLGARGRGAQGAQAAWALGRWAARAPACGALERPGALQQARQQAGQACMGADGRGHAAGRAGGRRAGRAQQGRGRHATWALGARPGRLGWPWAVHSVHSAHFQSVLTRFFFS